MNDKQSQLDIEQLLTDAMPSRPRLQGDIKVKIDTLEKRPLWYQILKQTSTLMLAYWIICGFMVASYFYLFPIKIDSASSPILWLMAGVTLGCFGLFHLLVKHLNTSVADILFKALE